MTPARLALFASVAAMGIGLLVLCPDPALPPVGPAPRPSAAAPSPVARPQAVTAAPSQPSARMRARFEKTDNYAAFIQDAMQRPDEGGLFYATLAFHRCKRVAPLVQVKWAGDGDGAVRAAAVQAWEGYEQRCAGVAGQFPDEAGFMRAIKLARARGALDVLAPDGIPSMARSAEDAQRAYTQAQALGDPYLIAITLEADAPYLAGAIDPVFANGANDDVFRYATSAAVCELLDACVGGIQSAEVCAIFGRCIHADYRDHLGDGLDPQALELFNRTRKKLLQIGRGAK